MVERRRREVTRVLVDLLVELAVETSTPVVKFVY